MSQPRPFVRLAPITANQTSRNPKILLGGKHQPTLLRYLDGWPRRKGQTSAFLIQFVEVGDELAIALLGAWRAGVSVLLPADLQVQTDRKSVV